jgi:hypothetical protein
VTAFTLSAATSTRAVAGRNGPPFPHGALTQRCSRFSDHAGVPVTANPPAQQEPAVDVVFILIIVGLYAGTHWLISALSRLGGVE